MFEKNIKDIKQENLKLKKELAKTTKEYYLFRKEVEYEINKLKKQNQFRIGKPFDARTFFEGLPYTYYIDLLNIGYEYDKSRIIDGENVVILKRVEKDDDE